MKNNKLDARRLKGFPDFFAQDVKLREYVIDIFKKNFERYGYEPLETPALELTELMVGISGGEAEKQFYRFQDPGGRDVMLKYEVMTSMCRAVGENFNNMQFPYKRYQIQKVWRAENVQKGRYREFTQCDADTVGSSNVYYDAEFIGMGLDIVKNMGFKKFIARISNRKFLDGLSKYLGLEDEMFYGFFMSMDKLKKIGIEGVVNEMIEVRGIEKSIAEKALEITDFSNYKGLSYLETIDKVKGKLKGNDKAIEGLQELEKIGTLLKGMGINESLYMFDLSLARGLASYTGPVWEFEVIDGGVGSIAGCGRYDNVIGRYTGVDTPATGGSFGIERMCDIIKDTKMLEVSNTPTEVMISIYSENELPYAIEVAKKIREQKISVMIYADAVGFGKQFKYADKKGIPYVVVIGPEEVAQNIVQIKDMKTKESKIIERNSIDKIQVLIRL